MVILITGATHTGKTALAQKLLERYKIPYYSIDHIKMGLIRSGQTTLTPKDEVALTSYLWSVVREIIKTAVENEQNLIIEGDYIPFDWQTYFDERYLCKIRYYCLVMTDYYIAHNFEDILKYENVIERRRFIYDLTMDDLFRDNACNLRLCKQYNLDYILIDDVYEVNIDLDL